MKKKNYFTFIILISINIFIGLFISAISSQEFPLQRHIAFLYIGKDTQAKEMAFEKEIQKKLVKMRESRGLLSGDIPVVSYHFDKKKERETCKEMFGIKEEQLPYLCLVELNEKNIPSKVFFQIDCVKINDSRIYEFFENGIKLLKED